VIAATSNRKFNERVARLSRRKRIWVNVVDDPELCDFTVPAVVERGPLQIAISTGGTSPLFARRLREELEKVIHPSTGRMLEKIGKIRGKWVRKKNS
jgi:siroheme synthase-like protein